MRTSLLICLLIGLTLAIRSHTHHRLQHRSRQDTIEGFCADKEHPSDCAFFLTVCVNRGWFLSDCQTDFGLFRDKQINGGCHGDVCDDFGWLTIQMDWIPEYSDVQANIDAVNALANDPQFGFIDNGDTVIQVAPDYCDDDLDFKWQCSYLAIVCSWYIGENIDSCQSDYEGYITAVDSASDGEFESSTYSDMLLFYPDASEEGDFQIFKLAVFGDQLENLDNNFNTAPPHIRGRRDIRHLGTFNGEFY